MSENLIPLERLTDLHTGHSRLMGLDLGTKTIGIAISDSRLKVATARTTLTRRKFTLDVEELVRLAGREEVFAFVLGLPLNMDGSEGRRAQSTRSFARNMTRHTDLPVVLWDERLSTYAADQAMIEADMSRKKRAEKIDAVAAAIILQGALDQLQAG
ncbi:MAG: Holliday junction resolvase RuvX [Rhizobiaceae bacterium]|nr:Holliday junction resolvase RuvX [Rhizobiaceae bacterium]